MLISAKNNHRRILFPSLFLLLGVFTVILVFWPPYADSFYADDFKHFEFISGLVSNPFTVYKIVNPFWIGWYYRPFVHLFFFSSQLLFGFTPPFYYALLIVGHVIASLLLYVLARRLEVGNYGAFFAVTLFAIHVHNANVIGWISAVSIITAAIFLLAAIICFLNYLSNPHKVGWIAAVAVFYCLALLSREESFILPLLLLFVRWEMVKGERLRRAENGLLLTLIVIFGVYMSFMFFRPTWVETGLDGSLFTRLSQKLASGEGMRNFIVGFFSTSTLVALSSFNALESIASVIALLFSVLFIFWFWRGNSATRVGLVWTLLILLVLYLTIWRNGASLPGRYYYLPWLGISLALGATIETITDKVSRWRLVMRISFIILLVVFLLVQVNQVRSYQNRILNETVQYKAVRERLFELLPSVTADTHIFAYRSPITPDFFQAMTSVFYQTPLKWPGGDLGRLKSFGRATNEFYLFDYQDGVLVNLMPELQEHEQTYFFWDRQPEALIWKGDGTSRPLDPGAYKFDQLAGPESTQRLAIYTHPPAPEEGWASLAYTLEVPNNSQLQFGIYKDEGGVADEDGMAFRVRVKKLDGSSDTLFNTFWEMSEPDSERGWEEITIQMRPYWGQNVTLYFEVAAGTNLLHDHGYWSNPRFVVDE